MPRPKQFEPADTLVRAMEVFWTKGFDATSIGDLVAATGVNRFSLYEAFGDKHGLFARALEHYDGVFFQFFLDDLADPDEGVAAIVRCLRNLEARLGTREADRGCLMLNAASEPAARNPAVTRRIRRRLAQLEDALAAAIEAAQRRGEIAAHHDARDCARYLNALVQGITTMRRATGDREALRGAIQMAEATLATWRHPDDRSSRSRRGPRRR